MRKILLLLVFAIMGFVGHSQEKKTNYAIDTVAVKVEVSAQYPGGMDALYKYLAENLRYPEGAKDDGVNGRKIVEPLFSNWISAGYL